MLHRLAELDEVDPQGLRRVRLQARGGHALALHEHGPVRVLLRHPQGRALLRALLQRQAQGGAGDHRADLPPRALWLAPLLCFTAEEAWLARYPSEDGSVHLEVFPEVSKSWRNDALAEDWEHDQARAPRGDGRAGDRARQQEDRLGPGGGAAGVHRGRRAARRARRHRLRRGVHHVGHRDRRRRGPRGRLHAARRAGRRRRAPEGRRASAAPAPGATPTTWAATRTSRSSPPAMPRPCASSMPGRRPR